jgi:hypothetical protein
MNRNGICVIVTAEMLDQPDSPQPTTISLIDSAAKLSATALLIVYVAGFLVVSIHNARYGFVQHDLVRPRLLATGTLFFVFLAVGLFVGSVTFRVFFFKEHRAITDPKLLRYLHAGRIFDLLLAAMLSSLILGFFFTSEHHSVRFWFGFLAIFAVNIVHGYLQYRRLEKSPRLVTVLAALLFLGSAVVLVKTSPEPFFARTGWFILVGMLTLAARASRKNLSSLVEALWGLPIGAAALVVASFALFLYPKMRAPIGGGELIPVVLQFKEKSPMDTTQQQSFGWILDESDAGFYLLKNDQDKDAVFVPRTDVTLVFYGDAERIKKLIKP